MKWVLAEGDRAAVAVLSENGYHPLVARLLVNRGITDPAAARLFLAADLSHLSPASIFSGMERAVGRIQRALADREKIVVYGDYDVDGVTGASLLYLVLRDLGADVGHYIPDRISEGYGLNTRALETIRATGAGLVITVDCGISAMRESEAARSLGLDLIITDHHEIAQPDVPAPGTATPASLPETALPDAFAILHPWLLSPDTAPDIREQVKGLTGVGVAFKLAQALLKTDAHDERMQSCLDLVTLGTIADVGRITGENRVFVKHGLDRLSRGDNTVRPGVAALKEVAGLAGKRISAGNVGFALAPRINASGRLERADMAFRLLTTESPKEALTIASALDEVNKERQTVEGLIQEDARRLCREQDLASIGAFVLASPDWHPGVIGIVASRIVEEFYRPTALVCVRDGVGKGSARSIPGFDLYHGLLQCGDLLLGFGGHKYAAGFTIAEERIPEFRERLSSLVRDAMGNDGFLRTQIVDEAITLDELSLDLLREIDRLAPFGQGNPEPRLGTRGLSVVSSRIVGNNHLKLRLKQENGTALDAIAFNRGRLLGKQVRDGERLAIVFTPRANSWNGNTAVELEIRDFKKDREGHGSKN